MRKKYFFSIVCLSFLIALLCFGNSASAQTCKYKYVYTETGNGARIQAGSVTGIFNNHITFTRNKENFYTSNANGYGDQYSENYSRIGSNPPKYKFSPNNSLQMSSRKLWDNAIEKQKGYHATGIVKFTESYKYMLVCLSDGGVDVYEKEY